MWWCESKKTRPSPHPFSSNKCWPKTASEKSMKKFSQEPSNLAHTVSDFFQLWSKNKLNHHAIKMQSVNLQCTLKYVCPDSHPCNSVTAYNNFYSPWCTRKVSGGLSFAKQRFSFKLAQKKWNYGCFFSRTKYTADKDKTSSLDKFFSL